MREVEHIGFHESDKYIDTNDTGFLDITNAIETAHRIQTSDGEIIVMVNKEDDTLRIYSDETSFKIWGYKVINT